MNKCEILSPEKLGQISVDANDAIIKIIINPEILYTLLHRSELAQKGLQIKVSSNQTSLMTKPIPDIKGKPQNDLIITEQNWAAYSHLCFANIVPYLLMNPEFANEVFISTSKENLWNLVSQTFHAASCRDQDPINGFKNALMSTRKTQIKNPSFLQLSSGCLIECDHKNFRDNAIIKRFYDSYELLNFLLFFSLQTSSQVADFNDGSRRSEGSPGYVKLRY